MRTVKQISAIVGRAPSTVYSQVLRLRLEPSRIEVLSKQSKRYWYKDDDVNKVLDFYLKLDNPEVVVEKKPKRQLFPSVIYVTRTTEIYPSKLNYLTFEKL